jgi:uncharacterized Zn-finger protein
MMAEFSCGICRSVEFTPIVHIHVSAEGKITELADEGSFKCSNCSTRYLAAEDGSITVLEAGPQAIRTPRVRSSVSGADRGVDPGSAPRKF